MEPTGLAVLGAGIGAGIAILGGGVGICIVIGVLTRALRSLKLGLAAVSTLLIGQVWTAAFAGVTVGHLSIVSASFAVLFIGLGVDFGIHFGMRYAELVRAQHGHEEALAESSWSVGGSLVLCAFTTAMSFYVFVPTDYKAVGELGLISGTGMLVSLFCSLTTSSLREFSRLPLSLISLLASPKLCR